MRAFRRGTRGFTLVEMLVTLAVLSILMAIGFVSLRPPSVRLAANSVRSFVQQARFEAIKTNRPMVVGFDAVSDSMTLERLNDATVIQCATGLTLIRSLALSEYPRVTATPHGLPFIWLPSGQPRACSGVSLSADGARVGLVDASASATVRVDPGGAVTVE